MSTVWSDGWSEKLLPKQRAFLEKFSMLGSITLAADGLCHRSNHYLWLDESELYRKSFQIARKIFGDSLTYEAIHRALNGKEEQVFYKGRPAKDEQGNLVTRNRTDRSLLKHLIELHTVETTKRDRTRQNSTSRTLKNLIEQP